MNLNNIINEEFNKESFSAIDLYKIAKAYIKSEPYISEIDLQSEVFAKNDFIQALLNSKNEKIEARFEHSGTIGKPLIFKITNKLQNESITIRTFSDINNLSIIFNKEGFEEYNKKMKFFKMLYVERDSKEYNKNVGVTLSINLNLLKYSSTSSFTDLITYMDKKHIETKHIKSSETTTRIENIYLGSILAEVKETGFLKKEFFDLLELQTDVKMNELKTILLNTFNPENIKVKHEEFFVYLKDLNNKKNITSTIGIKNVN